MADVIELRHERPGQSEDVWVEELKAVAPVWFEKDWMEASMTAREGTSYGGPVGRVLYRTFHVEVRWGCRGFRFWLVRGCHFRHPRAT